VFMTDQSGPTRQPDETAPDEGAARQATGATAGATTAANVAADQAALQKPTVYRGVGSLVGGIIVAVMCLAGILDLLIESGTQDLLGVAVLTLIIAVATAYGIYPAAFSGETRLTVRNPFRTIIVPWSAVTDLNARLSFVVHTELQKYTVWAIPVSLHDRRKAERERLKELSRANRPAGRGRMRALPDMPMPRAVPRTDPIERLPFSDQALREMRERMDVYETRTKAAALLDHAVDADQPVTVRWTWPMPAAIGCAALFVLLVAVLK
jgi:hypothetical protein